MRKLIAAASIALAAVPAWAATPELDEVVMQNIEVVNESLASNLGLKDGAAASTDANDLDQLLAEVETYFVRRGDADDAVGYARKSREATAGIIRTVGEGRFEAASELATEISRTCKTCHRKYKPD